jgi:membrane peptidoglycan carboxypeptidase
MSWRSEKSRTFIPAWVPRWLQGPLRLAIRLGVLGSCVFLAGALLYFGLSLKYDLAKVAQLPSRTAILDRTGQELEVAGDSNRRLIVREQIPEFMVKALRAREDARFFDHSGVDFLGLARATLRNIKDRSFTQGASTLSMQLARNSFDIRAKSLHRKFLEIAITLRLERQYTKDEILAHYLNRIYFGAGCDGVEEAARTYFGKTTSDLAPSECAMLVGIIRGPHIFSPFRNLDAAVEQRDQVLTRMIAMQFITKEEAAAIRAEPIRLVPLEMRQAERSYALQAIHAERDLILDRQDIQNGGLRISTTLDRSWQQRLEKELTQTAVSLEEGKGWPHPTHEAFVAGSAPAYLQMSAVTLEKGSGAILALVGGRDFLDSRFDRSISARRDLGSTFEPFIAAAAAERGKLILPSRPLQTGRQIGSAETERITRRLGITGRFLEGDDLFRGGAAASPLETAVALATLATKGKRPSPYIIREITDASGRVLFTRHPDLSQAISADAANESLRVFSRSGSSLILTGSTHSCTDAWLQRVGPSGATVAWFGFDNPTRIADSKTLDAAVSNLAERLGQ